MVNIRKIKRWSSVVSIICCAITSVNADHILQDEFNGATVDASLWTTVGNLTPTVDGFGNLTERTTGVNASQRSFIVSQQNNLDFFSQHLSVTLSGLLLSGDPGANANSAFIILGQSIDDTIASYYTKNSLLSGALVVLLSQDVNGYSLVFREVVDGVAGTDQSFALSGAPTDITVSYNGESKAYTFDIVGTTFAASGLTTASGNWSDLEASNLTLGSRVSIGAINAGAVADNTQLILDSISVNATAVPDPPSVGLYLIGFADTGLLSRIMLH